MSSRIGSHGYRAPLRPSSTLRRGRVPGQYRTDHGRSTITPKARDQRRAPAKGKSGDVGILTSLWNTITWMISGIHDLLFLCFVEKKEGAKPEEKRAENEMVITLLDKWFPKSITLGQHLEAHLLKNDLNKLPDALFQAVAYAFFKGNLPPDPLRVESFVDNFVMKVTEPRPILESSVIQRIKLLSKEEFQQLLKDFFNSAGYNPDLCVEAFVKRHVMKSFGAGLHAGILIEDLQGLSAPALQEVYSVFFQGKKYVPDNLAELSVESFVDNYVTCRVGAMERLQAALRLQIYS